MNIRLTALILAALFVTCLGFSCLYIASEADHDCHGENCIICCILSVCKSLLNGCFTSLPVLFLGFGAIQALIRHFSHFSHLLRASTPVTMHIRLLD